MTDDAVDERAFVRLYDLLERSARAGLELQQSDGSFPPSHNGIYGEPETPVRTTSHWVTTLSGVYEVTGDDRFADAAADAADFLLSDDVRPHGFTFHSRNVDGKDKCDGLVGQAAPIRGLARAGRALNRPDLIDAAAEVFQLHPFDERLGLWERVEIDGTRLSFDRTLNHQLTFASAALELLEDNPAIEAAIDRLLEQLANNLRTHTDGLIKHYVRPSPIDAARTSLGDRRHWRLLLNEVVFHYYSRSDQRREKEMGYHPVNLRGLAKLKVNVPEHPVWNEDIIEKAISFVTHPTSGTADKLINLPQGSMTPGIHMAYSLYGFGKIDSGEMAAWIERDIGRSFDFESNLLTANAIDPDFQAATIYNLLDLPDIEISVSRTSNA